MDVEMRRVWWDPRYWVDDKGNVYSTCSGALKILKPNYGGNGYVRIRTGRGSYRPLHRVIWEAFHGEIPPKLQVRHLNGVRDDNRLVNLRVGTQSDNELDKRAYGADPTGSRHGQATITEDIVVEIRELWDAGKSAEAIKRELGLGMTASSVHAVATSISWKHVPPARRAKRVKGGPEGFRKRGNEND